MNKPYRRTQILDLIRTEAVTTQEELRRKLGRRGIHVTQATVSRDIEELGLVKGRTGYRVAGGPEPPVPPQPTLAVVLKEFLVEARQASNLLVLKTSPGNAHSVAVALDSEPWPEIVGTVAGDDTILAATRSAREAAQCRRRILALVAV